MSLNTTEKKSLDYIEKLVVSVEKVINEESRKWSSESIKQEDSMEEDLDLTDININTIYSRSNKMKNEKQFWEKIYIISWF